MSLIHKIYFVYLLDSINLSHKPDLIGWNQVHLGGLEWLGMIKIILKIIP